MNANHLPRDAADLRWKAGQCRKLARVEETPASAAEQLLRWAEDYEEEAAVVEKAADHSAA
jgi:hypothetical protein